MMQPQTLIANSPTFQRGYVEGWRWGLVHGCVLGGTAALMLLACALWLGRAHITG